MSLLPKPKRSHRVGRAYYTYVRRKKPVQVELFYDLLNPHSEPSRNARSILSHSIGNLKQNHNFARLVRQMKWLSDDLRARKHQLSRMRSGTKTHFKKTVKQVERKQKLQDLHGILRSEARVHRDQTARNLAMLNAFHLLFLNQSSPKYASTFNALQNGGFSTVIIPPVVLKTSRSFSEQRDVADFRRNAMFHLRKVLGPIRARRFLSAFLKRYTHLMRDVPTTRWAHLPRRKPKP